MRTLGLALLLYIIWLVATYVLEGRLLTFQRPEAQIARLTYALVANVAIGLGLGLALLRVVRKWGAATPEVMGFQSFRHALIAVLFGVGLGWVSYVVQGPPSLHPVVLANAYAQVLVVSAAEVVVCWIIVGRLFSNFFGRKSRNVGLMVGVVVASAVFGLYHVAHSPPFNSVAMVALLSGVGLVTSAFYFISRDVYGTIAFHNFLALTGVMRAIESSGALAAFRTPMLPLFATASLSLAVLVSAHRLWLRPSAQGTDWRSGLEQAMET